MKITLNFLKKKKACENGIRKFKALKNKDTQSVFNYLKKRRKFEWANWVILRLMTRQQCTKYAIYAAEQVISIYEKSHPKDKRPRKAIQTASKVLKNDTPINRKLAYGAARAAYSAADTCSAAYCPAYAPAYSAATAYHAAYAAVGSVVVCVSYYESAYAAVEAAANAAYAYAANAKAAYDARIIMQIEILNYGLKLLNIKHEIN